MTSLRDGQDLSVVTVGLAVALAAGAAAALYGPWLLILIPIAAGWFVVRMAWRRSRQMLSIINVTPNMALIALPTVVGAASINITASLAATALVTLATLFPGSKPKQQIRATFGCLVLPAVGAVIVLRANYPSTVTTAALFALACIAFARGVFTSTSRHSALVSLIDGAGLYVVVSVALWVAGVSGPQFRTAGLDNSLTGGERAIFPLTTSLAATPAIATAYVAAAIPLIVTIRKYRTLRLTAVTCAVAVFVLSDSRVSFVSAAILATCVLFLPRAFRAIGPWMVAVIAVVPFIYGYIQGVVGSAQASIVSWFPQLVRSGEQFGTLNYRDLIWSRALDFYVNEVDWLSQALGFGAFGHTESGASATYYSGFAGFGEDQRLVTPHNSTLQILFDGGWIAALATTLTMIFMALRFARSSSPIDTAGLSMTVALSIVALTEVAISPGHAQATWWALYALALVAFATEPASQVSDETVLPPMRRESVST